MLGSESRVAGVGGHFRHPWLGLRGYVRVVRRSGLGKLVYQPVEMVTCVIELPINQDESFDDEPHMRGGDPTDAVLFQDSGERRLANALARARSRQFPPQIEHQRRLEDRRSDCLFHDRFRLPAGIGQSCNTTVFLLSGGLLCFPFTEDRENHKLGKGDRVKGRAESKPKPGGKGNARDGWPQGQEQRSGAHGAPASTDMSPAYPKRSGPDNDTHVQYGEKDENNTVRDECTIKETVARTEAKNDTVGMCL